MAGEQAKLSRLAFPTAGGEMGLLLREHDWSRSSLGDPTGWPHELRAALQLCLDTPIVGAVHWGPELLTFYNDAYAPVLADRHPHALGQPLSKVWPEVLDVLAPQYASVMKTGRGFSTGHQLLRIRRNGRLEDTYWIYSFAPVHADGAVAGVFVTAFETTDKVVAERRLTEVQERQRHMLQQMPGFVGMLSGPELVFTYVNDAYVAISERTAAVSVTSSPTSKARASTSCSRACSTLGRGWSRGEWSCGCTAARKRSMSTSFWSRSETMMALSQESL